MFGERGLKDHINISFIYNFMCIAQINQEGHTFIYIYIYNFINIINWDPSDTNPTKQFFLETTNEFLKDLVCSITCKVFCDDKRRKIPVEKKR